MFDVAVVGGGVAGLFSAYHLALRGYSVALAHSPGNGATRASGGLVTPSFASVARLTLSAALRGLLGLGAFRVSARWALGNLGWIRMALSMERPVGALARLAEHSLREYRAMLRGDLSGVYWVEGLVGLFRDPREALLFASQFNGELVEERELEEHGVRGLTGVLLREEIFVNPEELQESLLERLPGMGVRVIAGRVVSIRGDRSGVRLLLEGGERIVAEHAVIAAGSWSRELLEGAGYRVPLAPARGLALIVDSPGKLLDQPMLLEDYGVVIAPQGGSEHRITGFFELVGYERNWSPRRRGWLLGVIRRHAPLLHDSLLRPKREYTGYRPCTPDEAPIVGRIPGTRIILNTGHCRLGITTAPATARIVADIVDNGGRGWAEELRALRPERFGLSRPKP